MSTTKMITRIAPSPTGDPHVGTAYMSLFDYIASKKTNGKFILRIEDTDQSRYNPESEQKVIDMLHWLGLNYDEGPDIGGPNAPYHQLARKEIYQKYAQQLLDQGKAYRAFETPEELAEIRKDLQRRRLSYGYDGRASKMPKEESDKRAAAGEPFVIRLKTPNQGETIVHDALRKEIVIPNKEVTDAVLIKADGIATYHLAVVVDDHLMGVSHVIRGEEWISTAPVHVLLYQAFGWQEPVWVHMPLLKNASGKKLSKRRDDANVDSYRRQGIVPEALLNYLGTMGFSMPNGKEFFSIDEMIEHFSFDRISLGGSIFDMKRLKHYNKHYLKNVLDLEKVAELASPFLKEAGYSWDDQDYLYDVVDVLLPRVDTLKEIAEQSNYFFTDDFDYSEDAKRRLEAGQKYLEGLERELSILDFFDYDDVDNCIRGFVKSQGVKMGEVMMPLRAALAGTTKAPGVTDIAVILGKSKVLERIGKALSFLEAGLPDDKPEKNKEEAEKEKKEKQQARKGKKKDNS